MLKDWESSLNKFSSNIFYWVIKVESVEKFQFLVRIVQSNCWRCWCDGNMSQTLSDYWHHTLMLDISHPQYVTDTWLTVKMNCEVDASPWGGICVKYFLDDVHTVMTPDQAVLGFKSVSEPCSGPVTRSVSPALSSPPSSDLSARSALTVVSAPLVWGGEGLNGSHQPTLNPLRKCSNRHFGRSQILAGTSRSSGKYNL